MEEAAERGIGESSVVEVERNLDRERREGGLRRGHREGESKS